MPPNRSSFPPSRQSVLQPLRKTQKNQEPSRLVPCPVCNRSFPSYFIHDHVHICLDSPATGRTQLSTSTVTPPSSSCNSQRRPHLSSSEDSDRSRSSSTGELVNDAKLDSDGLKSPPVEQECTNPLLAFSTSPLRESSEILHELNSVTNDSVDGRDGGARMPESEAQVAMNLPKEDSVSGDPGHTLQIFQVQRQSQAKLSMLCKFPMSAALKRKPTVTVLQPGMVLLRSWLSLDIQQRFVNESQSAAHLFKRPTTAGGGKYHLWQMAFGCQWDSKTRRYAAQTRTPQRFPAWMYHLGKELASDAHNYTPVVYPHGSDFAPDVALVNFYPVKDEELGVVGLGGHQDLDDYCDMPVVSVSVGDSMTFFYRRVPPQSRRKSGVQIAVDETAAKNCKDGDMAHNSEKRIILESGDVLVFGGESRLVYHGTRNVQPGTRPPGLHMAPGRLNFTFRQCNATTS